LTSGADSIMLGADFNRRCPVSARQHGKLGKTLRRLLPWAGTVLLLGYLGWTTDLDAVGHALSEVSILAALAVALVGTLLTFLADSYCVGRVFSRFVLPVGFREALPIKATSYFLNILNYNAALVGMAFYLQASRKAPFWKSLGALFFLNLVDIHALCVLLGCGLVLNLGAEFLSAGELTVAWGAVAGGIGGFWLLVLTCRFDIRLPVISRVLRLDLLRPLAEARVADVLVLTGLRMLFLLLYIGSQYLFLRLFGVAVPALRLLVYMPLLTFIQIIPISVSGLGAPQLVMRHFYAPYVKSPAGGAEGVIDAFSTTSIFGFVMFRVLVAYLFLGEFSREVIERAGRAAENGETEPTSSPGAPHTSPPRPERTS